MYRIEILLPLYRNDNRRIARRLFEHTARELTERFGGLTAYTRAPAKGFWKKSQERTVRDEIVIYEVLCRTLDRAWWKKYKAELERRFSQDEIVVRAQKIEMLR